MQARLLNTMLGAIILFLYSSFVAVAQSDTAGASQDELFQKYQAMVIIEELNQRCPLLSRLEAEVLNGQIIFANSMFSGKLDVVDKFKREARIFARGVNCDAPEVASLIGSARQEASDSMINHMLLSRQIHLLDEKDVGEGKVARGLFLDFLIDDEWQMIENLHQEVKNNYLTRASTEEWEKFEESILNVAEEKTTAIFLRNENLIKTAAADTFESAQAKTTNMEVSSYYFNLEKSVRAFVTGASAAETGYPYTRPANDFTNWMAYRARDKDLSWVLSYVGCGSDTTEVDCTLFSGIDGEIGLVISGDIEKVTLEYRNPENEALYRANKTIEGPIGSNELSEENLQDNLEMMMSSSDKVVAEASYSDDHKKYLAQVGSSADENSKVYILPKETLSNLEKLHRNDLLKLTILFEGQESEAVHEGVVPMHNYHRARNWAYSDQ